jgi:membrane protease YdiL (CAAX protease family)
MRVIANPKILERKAMRTDIRAVAIAMIGFLTITSLADIIMIFLAGGVAHGAVYLASSFVGLAFIWFCFRSDFYLGDILYERRAIPAKVLRNSIVCVVGAYLIFRLISQGLLWGFHEFGYKLTFNTYDPMGRGMVFVLLNSIIFSPIIEEALFRGVMLRILSRYGRNFAIVTSAILFGLYSTDFIELFHAFALGLLLAYITFRYSIKWAAVLHCTNNLVMNAVVIAGAYAPWFIIDGVLGVFLVWGIIVAARKFAKVRRFAGKGRSAKNAYAYFFTAPAVIIYIIIALTLTFLQTGVIPTGDAAPSDSSPLQIASLDG